MSSTLATATKFCHSCGSSVHIDAEICIKCGVRQIPTKIKYSNAPSRVTYALLKIFLNQFGAHAFYKRNVPQGLLRLILYMFLVTYQSWHENSIEVFNFNNLSLSEILYVIVSAFSLFLGLQAFISGILWLFKTNSQFETYCSKKS